MNCKPGYVSDGHLSRPAVAGRLKRPTRTVRIHKIRRRAAGLSCSVLLRMGFTYAPRVTARAVVSYTAFAPLPAFAGGIFLLHWPGSRLHRTLSGILPCEARTFLTCSLSSLQPRPSVPLRRVPYHNSFVSASTEFYGRRLSSAKHTSAESSLRAGFCPSFCASA